mgnify:CR=1 FL=1
MSIIGVMFSELSAIPGSFMVMAALPRERPEAAGGLDLPVLGRLFSSERSDRSKTEIVLLITPRVVRNLATSPASRSEQAGGTEKSVGAPRLQLQGAGKLSVAPSRGGASSTREPGAPQAEVVEVPAAEPEVSAGQPVDGTRQRTPRRRAEPEFAQ